MRYALVAAGTILVLIALVLAVILPTREERPPASAPVAFSSATPSPSASPSPSPLPPGTYVNTILGYRITLPTSYRRSASALYTGQLQPLGRDTYTTLTEADERAACLTDGGDIPSLSSGAYLNVEVYRNAARASAADWIRARPESTQRTIEPALLGGLDAVTLVQQAQTMAYVIGANERMYIITPSLWPSQHRLDDIAAAFVPFVAGPFPTATPTEPPLDAARALGQRLAQVFAAKDADAVAALMPSCRIGVGAVVGSNPTGGALNRSVALFSPALRERFASGELSVTVDPVVQIRTQGGPDRYFVRSEWREPDRTIKIDLDLGERDGRWQWLGATHYYPSLIGRGCIPYRSPWVSVTGTC